MKVKQNMSELDLFVNMSDFFAVTDDSFFFQFLEELFPQFFVPGTR